MNMQSNGTLNTFSSQAVSNQRVVSHRQHDFTLKQEMQLEIVIKDISASIEKLKKDFIASHNVQRGPSRYQKLTNSLELALEALKRKRLNKDDACTVFYSLYFVLANLKDMASDLRSARSYSPQNDPNLPSFDAAILELENDHSTLSKNVMELRKVVEQKIKIPLGSPEKAAEIALSQIR